MWIDIASAVGWLTKRASHHPTACVYNRLISRSEFRYSLTCSAQHFAGNRNIIADAGSRLGTVSFSTHGLTYHTLGRRSQTTIRLFLEGLAELLRGRAIADTTSGKYATIWRNGVNSPSYSGGHHGSSTLSNRATTNLNVSQCTAGGMLETEQTEATRSAPSNGTIDVLDLSSFLEFTLLRQGIKRLSSPMHKLHPITPAFPRLLRHQFGFNQPQQRLLWGTILIGFFFLLRRSDSARHFYCLKRETVFFSDSYGRLTSRPHAKSVTIGLEGSKNDQYDRGAWRTMHASGDREIYPHFNTFYEPEKRYKPPRSSLRGNQCSRRSEGLQGCSTKLGSTISKSLRSFDPKGGATSLLSGGADQLFIKLLG
ncbi:LOW QUALITY PROTEIN: hypothetical protein PHMEG_00024285 [Phytophthora megakarya]|uniref:Uncharacterized protein n=1 Tax=Phytophthora megakarya TaxID=4795 RepID=A0A225VE35_9STRA|nr:LOW QUALITY PROTEIN: hypothetical protein PHMEG_00024285 [Phytophthora megakarya]